MAKRAKRAEKASTPPPGGIPIAFWFFPDEGQRELAQFAADDRGQTIEDFLREQVEGLVETRLDGALHTRAREAGQDEYFRLLKYYQMDLLSEFGDEDDEEEMEELGYE